MRTILTVKLAERQNQARPVPWRQRPRRSRPARRRADLQLRQAPDRGPQGFNHLGQDRDPRTDGLYLQIRRQPLREPRPVRQPVEEDLSRSTRSMNSATCSGFRPAATRPSANSTSMSSSRPSPRSTPWPRSGLACCRSSRARRSRTSGWLVDQGADGTARSLGGAAALQARSPCPRRRQRELVIAPTPSISRLMRNDRKVLKSGA